MSQQTVRNADIKNFTPTRDWLLLPDPRIKEKSGIILDEKTAQSLQTNIVDVIAVGPETKIVEKGDIVMVNPAQSGTIIEIKSKTYVMVPEHFCLGVFKK